MPRAGRGNVTGPTLRFGHQRSLRCIERNGCWRRAKLTNPEISPPPRQFDRRIPSIFWPILASTRATYMLRFDVSIGMKGKFVWEKIGTDRKGKTRVRCLTSIRFFFDARQEECEQEFLNVFSVEKKRNRFDPQRYDQHFSNKFHT